LQKFRHRVAIIGWNDPEMVPSEYFESVNGDTAGVFLQANYIESLVDHRILTPVRLRVSILLTLLWFLVIEVIFRRWSARPEIALLYSLGSTLALAAIVYDWVVIQLGYYLVVWFPGILAILGRYSVLRLRSGGTE
jgi:CHASE2 domain-containing sensor protein